MATTLDVLVIERIPAAADETAVALERAGHRLHRCHDVVEQAFPCKGVRDPSTCPVEQGVDVAVLVRPYIAPRPSAFEAGVRCALRARIPLVEKGAETLDPFAPWVAARVDGDVTDACAAVVEAVFGELQGRIRRRTLRTMAATGCPGPLGCAIERRAMMGLVRLTRRAMRANLRGFPNDSR